MSYRRALLAVVSTALLLGLAWGCAAADNSSGAGPSGGGSNGNPEAGNEASVIMPEGGPRDAGSLALNPLCGTEQEIENSCVPDSPMSCGAFTPPLASEDASAGDDAAPIGQAGASGEGGAGGDGPSPGTAGASGDGGASGSGGASGAGPAAGDAGAGGASGAAGSAPMGVPPKYGCHVQRVPGSPDVPYSACGLAGPGGESAPCLTSNDCQAGFGCVGDQNAGLCRKFCCQDANACASGSYCAERPLRDATVNGLPPGASNTSKSLLVPVCIRAENCDLGAPYPCAKGSQCACESGTACLVVRSDGTTTCAVPGTGKVGEACPCAWGHVCSAATSQCMKLCYTRDSAACGSGRCQAASELPDGWGVCVGAPPDGG